MEFVQAAVATSSAAEWVSAILVWITLAAATVFLLAATRFVLIKSREPQGRRTSQWPAGVATASNSAAPSHRTASPVPPENPHAPPTPAYGSPRVNVPPRGVKVPTTPPPPPARQTPPAP